MLRQMVTVVLIGGMVFSASLASCTRQKGTQGNKTTSAQDLVAKGKQLFTQKGCAACHSVDGTKRVGPTMKGLYGKKVKVVTGNKEHEVVADEKYLEKSILEPEADKVKGYENVKMILPQPVSNEEVTALIAYIKSLK